MHALSANKDIAEYLELPPYYYSLADTRSFLLKKIEEAERLGENDSIDSHKIKNAIIFGEKAHKGQQRKSGGDFFIHPLRVAIQALDYSQDTDTVIGALLHDTVEDTERTLKDIQNEFGNPVSKLVNALTKVKKNSHITLEKIFHLANEDFRVILIKLLDRLDNITDLNGIARQKQRKTIEETHIIFIKVAKSFGLIEIEQLLIKRCFQHQSKRKFQSCLHIITEEIQKRKKSQEETIRHIRKAISNKIQFEIFPENQSEYEFFKSNKSSFIPNKNPEHILKNYSIITSTQEDCYCILGALHIQFKAIPLSIRDYISNPHANGWRGIETRIIIFGEEHLVIIMTQQHREKNRMGIIPLIQAGVYQSNQYKKLIDMYLGIFDDLKLEKKGNDFQEEEINKRIQDVFASSKNIPSSEKVIQILSKDGDINQLLQGASGLDFAYALHAEIGSTCSAVLIKHSGSDTYIRYTPFRELQEGDRVKVITDENVYPERKWLQHVIMPKSRKEILKFFGKIKNKKYLEENKIVTE